jgi:hypothetical protein
MTPSATTYNATTFLPFRYETMAPSSSCNHGYDTTLPDGSDPYKDLMNKIMKHYIFINAIDPQDRWATEFMQLAGSKFDATLERKIVATGLRMLSNPKPFGDLLGRHLCTLVLLCTFINFALGKSVDLERQVADTASEHKLALIFYKRAPCLCFVQIIKKLDSETHTERCSNPACRDRLPSDSLFECKRCVVIAYCSKECQKMDYPQHRNVCKLLAQEKSIEDYYRDMKKETTKARKK